MSDETDAPSERSDPRGSVARLAQALAEAQAVARAAEADESEQAAASPVGPDPTPVALHRPSESDDVDDAAARVVADPVESGQSDEPSGEPSAEPSGHHSGEPAGSPGTDERTSTDQVGTDEVPDTLDRGTKDAPARRLWPLYVAMVILILAVPTLAYIGYRFAGDSTTGDVLSGRAEPDSPGYTALVEPTPVALVMQTSDDGTAGTLAILSLSGPDQKGGAILSVPVNMRLDEPRFGIEQFAGIIEVNRPETAGRAIGSHLGLGFSEVVKVTDSDLVRLLEPVAPLQIDNPEPVTAADGGIFDAGILELSAEQVPAYLTATDAGDTVSGALARQRLVWQAWVEAIAADGGNEAVPGETSVGLGRYLNALAQGDVQSASFPVLPADELNGVPTYTVDTDPAMLLIANAVPFPVAANPGDRATVALLNGTGPEPAAPAVIQRLTYAGAQITTLGNAGTFDNTETTITYYDRVNRRFAEAMAEQLGVGRIVQSRSTESGADIQIVMGSDLTSDPPAPLTAEEVDSK